MAASRPSLKAEVKSLTCDTPSGGTHVVRILRGTAEVFRDLAPSKTAADAYGLELLAYFRRFSRLERKKTPT